MGATTEARGLRSRSILFAKMQSHPSPQTMQGLSKQIADLRGGRITAQRFSSRIEALLEGTSYEGMPLGKALMGMYLSDQHGDAHSPHNVSESDVDFVMDQLQLIKANVSPIPLVSSPGLRKL